VAYHQVPGKLLLPKSTTATTVTLWDLMEFDEEDWHTPAKIAHLNELAAKYNALELEFV